MNEEWVAAFKEERRRPLRLLTEQKAIESIDQYFSDCVFLYIWIVSGLLGIIIVLEWKL